MRSSILGWALLIVVVNVVLFALYLLVGAADQMLQRLGGSP